MTGPPLDLSTWMVGSVVTDADDRPLRVYHGTLAAIALHEMRTQGNAEEPCLGVYFASRPETANCFVGCSHGQIFPVYLRLLTPFDLRGLSLGAIAEAVGAIDPDAAQALRSQITGGLYAPYQALEFVDSRFHFGSRLRALGYDGVIFDDACEDTTYVVFDRGQIRSAFA